MDKTNEIVEVASSSKKHKIDKVIDKLVSIRPGGIFGFLAVLGAFYVYKSIQIGNF